MKSKIDISKKRSEILFMQRALAWAKKGRNKNEVPVGAIIVKAGKVIAGGHNTRTALKDPMGHAEIMAIKKAYKKLGDFRLSGCDMFVTVEPCILCLGAILQSRISRLVYGCRNFNEGAVSLLPAVGKKLKMNYKLTVKGGVLEDEGKALIQTFFKTLRNSR